MNKMNIFIITLLLPLLFVSLSEAGCPSGQVEKCILKNPFNGNCSQRVCIPSPDVSSELWGESGRLAYQAGGATMNQRSPTGEPLSDRLKHALRPFYGNLVDRVTIHWGITLLDEWSAQNMGINISGTESEGQTYGRDIFMRHHESTYNNRQKTRLMLYTLAHELVHVIPYEKWGSSLSNFGYHYFKRYKKANQSYENNEVEKEAEQTANAYIQDAYNHYTSWSSRPQIRKTNGIDYPGGDISGHANTSYNTCLDMCVRNRQCRGFFSV